MGADRLLGCVGGWFEPIPKLGDVGIDVISPGSYKWTVICRWIGNRTKCVVSVLQSGLLAHIAVKLLRDVSTFDVNIQQSNRLVWAIFAEMWHVICLIFSFKLVFLLCRAVWYYTGICVSISTHITCLSCARKKCDLHRSWCY